MDNQTVRKAVLAWIEDIILFGDNDCDEDDKIKRSLKQRFRIKTLRDLDYLVRMKIE